MIKSRQEIKADAKTAIREQRGTSILTLVILYAILFVCMLLQFAGQVFGSILYMVAVFFVVMPLTVGAYGVYIKIYKREEAKVGDIFTGITINYLRKVGGMAWMILFVSLWSLLLFIPGIIKGLSYSMAGCILADCPNVGAREALKLSMRMTKGYKMDIFVMLLSFIGWSLLGLLTLGILNLVFVNPYLYTTFSGYYIELKAQAIANGIISAEEFA